MRRRNPDTAPPANPLLAALRRKVDSIAAEVASLRLHLELIAR